MNHAVQTLKNKSKSFYWAGLLLPRRRLQDVATLYAFCREMDDAIDERGAAHEVEQALADCRQGRGNIHSLMMRYQIPLPVMEAFLIALLADTAPVKHTDKTSILRFAYGVAGTVGIMMSHVLGCHDHKSAHYAIDLGIAMQLVNIARDRAEDLALGRDYLPAPYSQRDLVLLAEPYFQSGMRGIHRLPIAVRPAIMSAAYLYRAIGERILAEPQRAARERLYVCKPRKAWLTFCALAACLLPRKTGTHDASLHQALAGLPMTDTHP